VADLLDVAIAAARAGGSILRERYGSPGRITMKPAGAGPVSEADLASEAAILSCLGPTGVPALSEEAGGAGQGRRWIVDPLDGTGNFIRHLPWFGVAVALAVDDLVELGAVYAPISDELFAAAEAPPSTARGFMSRGPPPSPRAASSRRSTGACAQTRCASGGSHESPNG
jgi:myo-inositol-1(or 4)-monophosphatase